MTQCRGCGSKDFSAQRVDLGNLQYSGFFCTVNEVVPAIELSLVSCVECGLVQLLQNPDPKWMYGPFYGYRSSQNDWMISHLNAAVTEIIDYSGLDNTQKAIWLDIGSNDGTLISKLPKDFIKIGVDPNLNKYKKIYDEIDAVAIQAFFGDEDCLEKIDSYLNSIDIITSFSVFYDLDDPNKFVSCIDRLLKDGGIWVAEQSYFPSMIDNNAFDTICHEHLLYLCIKDFLKFTEGTDLKLEKVILNEANGGSFRVYLKKTKDQKCMDAETRDIIKYEQKALRNWSERIDTTIKSVSNSFLDNTRRLFGENFKLNALGASTKGNIFLEVTGLGGLVNAIGEVNPEKYGKCASCYQVPIVPESDLLKEDRNVFLVLPWHFKDNFINNAKYSGHFLIFALPEFQVYYNGQKIDKI